MGGFFAPLSAAHDKRIKCAIGNGGPADLEFLLPERKANPILIKRFPIQPAPKTLRRQ